MQVRRCESRAIIILSRPVAIGADMLCGRRLHSRADNLKLRDHGATGTPAALLQLPTVISPRIHYSRRFAVRACGVCDVCLADGPPAYSVYETQDTE